MAWGYRHLGAAGLIVVLLSVWLYWKGNELAEKPGMRWLGGRLRRLWPLPRAVPGKFTVMLAVFDNDPGGESRENIFSWLQKIDGVAVTRTARKIATGDAAAGHRLARRWLRRCGADVLIWGRILQDGGPKRAPDLFWTAASAVHYKPGGERYAVIAGDMRLPQMFWDDFLDVLRLHIAAQAAEVAARAGHYVAETLAPRIAQMRKLLNASAPHARWTPAALAPMRWIFAGALLRYGAQKGDAAALMEAADAYRGVLTEWTRERTPLDWAMTQNNLGAALSIVGERRGDNEALENAVVAYRAALTERTRERTPLDWAKAQNNLGRVLYALGLRRGDEALLTEAAAACREALTEFTRERTPLGWAKAQNDLGRVLRALGLWRDDDALLKKSVAACRAALTEWTRERTPLDWAKAQNDLGAVLCALGAWAGDRALLTEAAAAYENALDAFRAAAAHFYVKMVEDNLQRVRQLLERTK